MFNISHVISRIIKLFVLETGFLETIVITVPLGHRGFFKRSFLSMEIGSFAVWVAVLCALFYTTCLSLFHKALVHAQALNPPFF